MWSPLNLGTNPIQAAVRPVKSLIDQVGLPQTNNPAFQPMKAQPPQLPQNPTARPMPAHSNYMNLPQAPDLNQKLSTYSQAMSTLPGMGVQQGAPAPNPMVSAQMQQFQQAMMPKPQMPMPMAQLGQPQLNAQAVGKTNGAALPTVGIAQKYIGQNNYKYGGWDCSKFTQTVAKQATGIDISRSTQSQMGFFQNKKAFGGMAGAVPGDIVYLRSGSSPSGRHTGVYIGNGQMIDNSGTGRPIAVRRINQDRIIGFGYLHAL